MRLLVWSGIVCGMLLGCASRDATRKPDEAQEPRPAASAEQQAPPTPVTPPET